MKRHRIRDVLSSPPSDRPVTVCGWVRTKRTAKRFAFLAVNDGSSQETLQLIVDQDTPAFAALDRVLTGAAIRARGVTRASPGAGQRVEMQVDALDILGPAPVEYPLQKKGHTLEFLRDVGHLRPRTNTFGAVFRIRNVLAAAVHEFFQQRGFVWAHTPIITGSDCEGAGEMFRVSAPASGEAEFFGRPAHLTVSGQLEAEFMAMALGDVYTFGPTFRAENSNTSRHLAEFWMIEPEMAFADLDADADLAEDFLKAMCTAALERCEAELAFLEKHYDAASAAALRALSESTFARLSYTEAADTLQKADVAFQIPHEWGQELASEHERYLTERVCGGPVIVMNYPRAIKPFYMRGQRRRGDGGGHGRAGAAHRRDHRRQPAGGTPVGAGTTDGRAGARPDGAVLVLRPAPIRQRRARRLRPRVRAPRAVRHRHGQHPRRHPLPARARGHRLLGVAPQESAP